MKKATTEALLEGGRVLILAFLSWLLLDGILLTIVGLTFGAHLDPTAKALVVGGGLTVLRALDKYLHEKSKPNTGILEEKGLTGF